jgi:hypothetical protein
MDRSNKVFVGVLVGGFTLSWVCERLEPFVQPELHAHGREPMPGPQMPAATIVSTSRSTAATASSGTGWLSISLP